MDAILRIMQKNKIIDYDLSAAASTIQIAGFTASQVHGVWQYQAPESVVANGKKSTHGDIHIGDLYVIDYATRTAGMVLRKPTGEKKYTNLKDGLSIGRDAENDIQLEDEKDRLISGHHCKIVQESGGWYVRDLKSKNGTVLNDEIVSAKKLVSGDILKVGAYRFEIRGNLCLLNADAAAVFHVKTREQTAEETFTPKAYPWFSRAPRILQELPPLHINIESAPAIGEKPGMGMMGMALSPTLLAVSLGMQALRFGLGRRKYSKQEKLRNEVYAKYLTAVEGQLQEHATLQKKYEERLHPSLSECMKWVDGPKQSLWERQPEDEDFLTLRLGLGNVKAQAQVEIPQVRLQLHEDELSKVPGELAEKYAQVENVPVCCNLIQDGNCGILGTREKAGELARALAVQIAALHSYDEVKIIALFPEREKEQWDWMRWLPHCMDEYRSLRYAVCGSDAKPVLKNLEGLVNERIKGQTEWRFGEKHNNLPHLVFIVADPVLLNNSSIGTALMMNQSELGVSGIFLGQSMSDFPHNIRNVIETGNGTKITLRTDRGEQIISGGEHQMSIAQYDRFARTMAPVRMMATQAKQQGIPANISLFDGLGIRKLDQLELRDFWGNTAPEKTLAVPIGIKNGGERFYFDIHEKAHGPHGMVAGGTGSGKSEMAKAWIASMALQFSPEEVNFVLVDFKGDSLLKPFEKLPHLAGSISNLDKDVVRSFAAMESELERRQQLVSDYECKDIIEYLKKRRFQPQMPVLPYLILIVDEFAEFKMQFPDFTKPMDHLYRGGRSLGLFVVLMTQNPSGIVTDQTRANANFRWCLRVKEAGDSRAIIDTTDAATIRVPGRSYVKAGDTYELVQSFYGGTPLRTEKEKKAVIKGRAYAVSLNGERVTAAQEKGKETYIGRTELDALVEYISEYCRRNRIPSARPLWQEVLSEKLDLFALEGQGNSWENSGWKEDMQDGPTAFIGCVDDPIHQSQFPLAHNFYDGGHLAVYGMPTSGRTTFLQTMLLSLANRYTPEQVQLYLIDVDGFGLRALETFPHVGAAAGDDEPENVEKIMELFREEYDRRKKAFRSVGAGSPKAYAEAKGKALPVMILMIDQLNQAERMPQEFKDFVIQIARSGASYGMYLVYSFNGVSGMHYSLSSNIKNIAALQFTDKSEYNTLVGRVSSTQGLTCIGRGFVKGETEPLLFQTAIAYPELGDSARIAKSRQVADAMREAWTGELPKGILVLEDIYGYGSLEGEPFVLGADVESTETVRICPEEHQSLLISADRKEQAQDLLCSLMRQTENLPGAEVILYSTDALKYREYAAKCALLTSSEQLDALMEPLADRLRARQAEYRQNPEVKFAPLVILIDGLRDCLGRVQGNTIGRLEVFIRLGKGLGITIVAADTAENMEKSRYSNNILMETMRQGAAVLLGGPVNSHQIVDIYDISIRHPQAFTEEDGCLAVEREYQFFRRMHGRNE